MMPLRRKHPLQSVGGSLLLLVLLALSYCGIVQATDADRCHLSEFTAEELQSLLDIGGVRTNLTPAEFMEKVVEIRPECAGRPPGFYQLRDFFSVQATRNQQGEHLNRTSLHRELSSSAYIYAGVTLDALVFAVPPGGTFGPWGFPGDLPAQRVFGQTFKTPDPDHKVLTSFTFYIKRRDPPPAIGCSYKAYVYEWDIDKIVGGSLFEGPPKLFSSLSTTTYGNVTESIPSVSLDPLTTYIYFLRTDDSCDPASSIWGNAGDVYPDGGLAVTSAPLAQMGVSGNWFLGGNDFAFWASFDQVAGEASLCGGAICYPINAEPINRDTVPITPGECQSTCASLNPTFQFFAIVVSVGAVPSNYKCLCSQTCENLTNPSDNPGSVQYAFNGGQCPGSSATSDPHLVGASGEVYDFDGEPGNTYSLFSAPQFQVAMHLAGDGPGTHFMTQIGLLFKGEEFLFGVTTMGEEFRADLEARLTRVGGSLLEWHPWFARVALCPGHTVSITQKHTTDSWLMRADGSPYNYYDVEIVSPGCHDAYDGALGQTYKCKYADGEPFVWSHGQEESFRLDTLFTPSGSYSVEAACDAEPAGSSLSGASARHQRRGLMSGAGKPAEAQVQAKAIGSPVEESHDALPSQPLRRYRKRTGPRTAEAQVAN